MSIEKIPDKLKISFKGLNHQAKNSENLEQQYEQDRNIPDAEYVKSYAKIQNSKDGLPTSVLLEKLKQKGVKDTSLIEACLTDKETGIYSRKFLTYLLSKKIFDKDEYIFKDFECVGETLDNQEQLDSKIGILEYIRNDDKLSQNEYVTGDFLRIAWNVDSPEKMEYTKQIFDTVENNPVLFKNENIKENIVNMTLVKDNPEEILQARLDLLNNFAKNPALQNNENISSQIGEIIRSINSETSVKFVQKYLLENKDVDKIPLLSYFAQLTKSVDTPEKLQVFETLYNNEKTKSANPTEDSINSMFKEIREQINSSAQDVADRKIDLLNTLSDDEKINKELTGEQIFTLVQVTNTERSYKAKKQMIENLNNIDGAFENTNGKLFQYIGYAQDDFAAHLLTKILSDKELANDKNVTDNLGKYASIYIPTQKKGAAEFVEHILDDKYLRSHPEFIKKLSGSFVRDEAPYQFLDKVLIQNKDKYDIKPDDYENIIGFAKLINDDTDKDNVMKFFDNGSYKDAKIVDEVLKHWTQGHAGRHQAKVICAAMSSPAVIDALMKAKTTNSAFYDTKTYEQVDAKISIIREFAKNKKAQQNSDWSKDSRLWMAIYNTETENAAKIARDLINADDLLENEQASYRLLFNMSDYLHKANSEAWGNSANQGYTRIKCEAIHKANEAVKNNKNLSDETKVTLGLIVNNAKNEKDLALANEILDNKDIIGNDVFMKRACGLFFLRNQDKIIEFLEFYKNNPEFNQNPEVQNKLYDIVDRYNPEISIQKYSDNKQFKQDLKDVITNAQTNNDVSALVDFYDYKDKPSIHDLSKSEKRKFMTKLMQNKTIFAESQENVCTKIPLLPKNLDEYSVKMKQIAQSMNLTSTPISQEEQRGFNKLLEKLSGAIQDIELEKVGNIDLKFSQQDFINQIQDKLKDLPPEEQIKIQDYYGFKIEDNTLNGYPTTDGKNISDSDIKDLKSIEAAKELSAIIDNYSKNNEIISDNQDLSNILNGITKFMPELYNQIDGGKNIVNTLKVLKNVCANEIFNNLDKDDKQIVLLSTLLNNTDKKSDDLSESAFDSFFISKRLGMNDDQAQKIYSTINASNNVEKFMELNKKSKNINLTNISFVQEDIVELERDNLFNKISFDLKDSNKLEFAQILYSSKYPEGFTRNFDKIMQDRIQEFKSEDFIMPQTPKEDYDKYSALQEVEKGNNKYKVKVVNSKDIPDFYAYAHTPEAGYCTGGSRSANLANFDAFQTLNDDKIICTGYITNGQAGLVKEFNHGFLLNVDSDKQYVGYGCDIFSLSKNIPNLVSEYYSQSFPTDNFLLNHKRENRKAISNGLKDALYDEKYSNISKRLDESIENAISRDIGDKNIQEIKAKFDNKIKELQIKKQNNSDKEILNKIYARVLSLTKIKNKEIAQHIIKQNIEDYNFIKDIDKKYAKRLDNLKSKANGKNISFSDLEKYDPEFAQAYRTSLLDDRENNQNSIMSSYQHNEFLVSNPQVSAIFTSDINDLPEEYLQKAQEENLPIVVINKK